MKRSKSGSRLIIICGLPGSGKTTVAKFLEQNLHAIRFDADEWMSALSIDLYNEEKRAEIEVLQWKFAKDLLKLGLIVIIEWGTWGRSERDTLRLEARALGAKVELHDLSASEDVLFNRIQHRGMENPPIKRDEVRKWFEIFQAPTSEEMTLFDKPLIETPVCNPNDRFFVITGGPGSGKTFLIEALRNLGFHCVEEAGRKIIQEQIKTGGKALHWENQDHFKRLMLEHAIETYDQSLKNHPDETVFFDRGLIDLVAYDRLIKSSTTHQLKEAVSKRSYNQKVFVAPPWKEIYRNDEERKQSFEEAIQTYMNLIQVYQEYGYSIIELPKVSVDERAKFILEELKKLA